RVYSLLLHLSSSFSLLTRPPPPRSTLFPYTTLFRSRSQIAAGRWLHPNMPLPPCSAVGPQERECFMSSLSVRIPAPFRVIPGFRDRKSTRLNSSHVKISYAVFCLKKKNKHTLTQRVA